MLKIKVSVNAYTEYLSLYYYKLIKSCKIMKVIKVTIEYERKICHWSRL